MTAMDLKQRLENDLKEAMLARDDVRKRTLRMALAAIKNAEIEKRGSLDEASLLAILNKELKSRQETIEEAQRGNREELIPATQAEIAVLQEYLPEPFTPEELEALAREVIAEVGASSPREMGQVMKELMPRLGGRADGRQASQMVRKLLGG
jgi:hypothetical protein